MVLHVLSLASFHTVDMIDETVDQYNTHQYALLKHTQSFLIYYDGDIISINEWIKCNMGLYNACNIYTYGHKVHSDDSVKVWKWN